MTEQFMENISNEEHERLLLLCGHGIGPSLSPAAQQVFWEFNCAASGKPDDWHYLPAIAAALRAAADQIRMKQPLGDTDADYGVFAAHNAISTWLLDIATELEGASD